MVKVSVLGKWYDLNNRIVEPIKKLIEETKDYDNYFINFCINYNGQEEIVDACKLIARQISTGKTTIDAINREIIKDNIYSSYFLPPDIIIKTGQLKRTAGFLLWDSIYSEIFFVKKNWPEIEVKDIVEVIKEFKNE
jgi:undecaprenyl diphosphate synthase